MPQFSISYFGGDQPASSEQGRIHFAQYKQWLADMGDAVVSPMNPIKDIATISPKGEMSVGSASGMTGYTIIEVDSIETAVKHAQECPFLDLNGTLEVGELVKIN